MRRRVRATIATRAIRSPCRPPVLCVASCIQPGTCKKNIRAHFPTFPLPIFSISLWHDYEGYDFADSTLYRYQSELWKYLLQVYPVYWLEWQAWGLRSCKVNSKHPEQAAIPLSPPTHCVAHRLTNIYLWVSYYYNPQGFFTLVKGKKDKRWGEKTAFDGDPI